MDKTGWHSIKQLQMPKNIVIFFSPPYSPELNPLVLIWRELQAKYFNNKTFKSMVDLENQLEFELFDFSKNKESIRK